MSVKTYTDRYKGFQIRDCDYIGDPPIGIPPTFDVVKWDTEDWGEEYCYSVGTLVYREKESCFDFKSVGLRWLEAHPSEEVERWVVKWAEYKLEELNNEYDC